jgi:cation diffusion facilitator family transporter
MRIFSGTLPERGIAPAIVLLAVIFVKSLMWFLSRRSVRVNGSPALAAVAADSKMDIVISSVALAGVGATEFGYGQFDAWVALLIAFWIAWIGWSIARENLDRLLGARPDTTTMRKIHGILNQLVKQKKIKSVRELRAQLLGSDVYIYVNVLAHKSLSSKKYHDLEEKIQQELGKVAKVERVSVHVDLE